MICDIICVDGFLCMLHLDIVHMLSAYVHVIHTLSGHMHILCTYLQWSLIYSFLTDNADVIHMSSLVLYISYYVQLSFCTLSAQTHIIYGIRMYTSFACHF